MALALVKLRKKRKGRYFDFLDYVSYDVAKLGLEIQGELHNDNEWCKPVILKKIEVNKDK